MLHSSEEVETAYYQAFRSCDAEAMIALWDEDGICIHPGGPRLIGLDTIGDSWRQIFAGVEETQIRIAERHIISTPGLAMHQLIEELFDGEKLHRIQASNVYRLGASGWRILLHHASLSATSTPLPAARIH